MNDKILKLDIVDNYRIIAISDIHGGYHQFVSLLKKLDIAGDDILIILGDVIEKGNYSYEAFEKCKELLKRKNTFYVKGNWEYALEQVFHRGPIAQRVLNYVKKVKYQSILKTWIEKHGEVIESFHTSEEVCDFLSDKIPEDIRFIEELPYAVVIDEFIFVHSGIEDRPDWEKSSIDSMLINDGFNNKTNCTDKYIVAGHWPTSNYREDSLCVEVLVNDDKKIISIDGGFQVKQTGQLNALIIEKNDGKITFRFESENAFKKVVFKKNDQFNEMYENLLSSDIVEVGWPDYRLKVIKKHDKVSLCKKYDSEKTFYMLNELIEENDGVSYSTIDYIANFLSPEDGTVIELVTMYDDFSLIKYNYEFGWVLNENIQDLKE